MAAEVTSVPDPQTGELVVITAATSEQLVGVAVSARERIRALTELERACKAELQRRLEAQGLRRQLIAGHEVTVASGRGREWDAVELETALRELVASGVLSAGQTSELIRTETVVAGRALADLLERLSGEPLERLEGCYRWVPKSAPSVRIAAVGARL